MSFRSVLAFLFAGFVAAAPALAETVKGNGTIKSETRTAVGFNGVSLALPAKVEVRIGPTESVTVEADENLLPLIETSVRNGSLEIKPVRRNLSLDSRSIRIVVQAKQVQELEIGGVGSFHAQAIRSTKLRLGIGGAGSMDLKQVEAEQLEVKIAGSGDIKLTGTARRLDASVAGSGDIDAPNFVVDDADIDIAGSGAAQLGVRKLLDVTVVGSGTVRYLGDPQVKRTVLGAGVIRRVGQLPL